MKVHILATVRKPELINAATLVFRTLRTGFPTANVFVWGNSLGAPSLHTVRSMAERYGCAFSNLPYTSHDAWIETIIHSETEPVWICDTDIVFWDKVEDWFEHSDVMMAGRFEPSWREPWTDSDKVLRLHTCLMFLRPVVLRVAIRAYLGRFPSPWGATAQVPLIRQTFIPRMDQRPLFYDSMAGLYHAIGGASFTNSQNEAFDHLHAATYADALTGDLENLREFHNEVYADHRKAMLLKPLQEQYYRQQSLCTPTTP